MIIAREYRQELDEGPPLPPAVEPPVELAVPALWSVSPGAEAVRVYGIQSADTSEGKSSYNQICFHLLNLEQDSKDEA